EVLAGRKRQAVAATVRLRAGWSLCTKVGPPEGLPTAAEQPPRRVLPAEATNSERKKVGVSNESRCKRVRSIGYGKLGEPACAASRMKIENKRTRGARGLGVRSVRSFKRQGSFT